MTVITTEAKIEFALRKLIAREVDYDIHKNLEEDEETGEDSYPALVESFVLYLNEEESK